FINTYLNLDGTPFTSNPNYVTEPFMEEVKNRDKRLKQTIRTKGYTRINGGQQVMSPPLFSHTYTGYQPIKWVNADMSLDGGSRSNSLIPIIRYAEVLLNFAEAKAELGSLTDEDWAASIGLLRKRAGITNGLNNKPVIVDAYLKSTFYPNINDPVILEVRRERGIELALEGLRFYDVIRWKLGELFTKTWNGMYVSQLNTPIDLNEDGVLDVGFVNGNASNPVAGVTYINVAQNVGGQVNSMQLSEGNKGEIIWLNNIPRVWSDRMYLYPIPENDLLMNPKLGQNPNW
ncbi:MAG: RagB/SusD family nutrient uptake outer membrane protein, partial [Ginsengibacter sp.]